MTGSIPDPHDTPATSPPDADPGEHPHPPAPAAGQQAVIPESRPEWTPDPDPAARQQPSDSDPAAHRQPPDSDLLAAPIREQPSWSARWLGAVPEPRTVRGAGPARASRRPARPLRHPAAALPLAIMFALVAAFFGWQAAEPLWLAAGHGVSGTVTVARCPAGEAASYRCVNFEADGSAFHVPDVTLLGAGAAVLTEGTRLPARMISEHHQRAYAASPAGLHLRWSIGLLLVLGCGAGIAWATGATRLDRPVARRRAVLLSFAGPLLLMAGFLVTAI